MACGDMRAPFSLILALVAGIQRSDVRRIERLFSAQGLGLARFL